MVDYYECLTYGEIDLDQDPCIFPVCGHVITRENLDQHFDMKDHYEFTTDSAGCEVIVGSKASSDPLSVATQKTCPACRSPLRNIHRYGRIERRAWIDEATKKFIVWANARFVPLAVRVKEAEERFQNNNADADENKLLLQILQVHSLAPLALNGPSDIQMRKIYNLTRNNQHYQNALQLRTDIKVFLAQVNEKEQPFSKIYDLVQDAKRHRGAAGSISWTPDVLQTRNRLLATVLLLRCEYAIMANFLASGKRTGAAFKINLQGFQDKCERLSEESHSKKQPTNQVEAHLFWARFLALQRGMTETIPDGSPPLLAARNHLQLARELCASHPGQTKGMLAEVDDVEKMLRESTFYTTVTNEEKAAVYAAMALDFRGTGHWYYCQNGHPFTVGECGMPMETSRCPQCGEAVGGQSHQAVEGVTRARDLDEHFGRLQL
ncbi:MAG: hypothetical protein Q9178_006225 [Gyalolechia marmorata]